MALGAGQQRYGQDIGGDMHLTRGGFRTLGALVVSMCTVATAGSAWASSGNWYYEQSRTGGGVGYYAQFGSATDQVLVGDWDGDGKDTLAVRRGNTYYVTNSPTGGAASYSFVFGAASDAVLVGDWNGDGKDTLGVRRGNMYYLTDNPRGGYANRVFMYGSGADVTFVGDWNGDGKDTLAVRRGNTYYFTNTQGGMAQVVGRFGSATDVVIDGDWNGDRKDTLGVRRGSTYYLTNRVGGGATDVVEGYGSASDSVYVGDWNGDKVDTLSVRRSEGPRKTLAGSGAYVVPTQAPPLLYKGSAPASGCYWERDSDFSGSTSAIIANFLGSSMAPLYVHVAASDAGFATDGCGTWVEARATDPVHLVPVADGQYRVGYDMAPGRYQALGGSECYWERDSDFSGELSAIEANDYAVTSPVVDVLSTDAMFGSQRCGTWTRLGDVPVGPAAASGATSHVTRPSVSRPTSVRSSVQRLR
ncbi:hypothetical protein GCM10027517_13200 [Phycicoccus ginsengisoli]